MTARIEVVAAYREPKEGLAPEECEDRYGISLSGPAGGVVVVSDGASMAA